MQRIFILFALWNHGKAAAKSPKVLLPFTTEEQKKLQSFVMDAPTPRKIGLLLGFQLGLRIGEICGLKWGDFDLSAGTVTIQRTVTRISCGNGHTKVIVQSPKTQNSHREIPLPKSLLRVLKKLSKDFSSGTWFLSGNEEKPVEPRCYRKSIYGYLKKPVSIRRILMRFATPLQRPACRRIATLKP